MGENPSFEFEMLTLTTKAFKADRPDGSILTAKTAIKLLRIGRDSITWWTLCS